MKVFKYLATITIGIIVYFMGIYIISGDFNVTPLTKFINDFEVYRIDLLNTAVALVSILLFSKILLSLLSRFWLRALWLGIFVLIAGTLVGVLLLLEFITFLDSRLLKITSVLLATSTILICLISLLAALTLYQYRKRSRDAKLLYKVSVRNPKLLMFRDEIRRSEVLLAPVIFLSYLVLLYFDSMYSGDEAIYTLNVPIYTFVILFSFLVLMYASIRHGRRLLR